MKLRKKTIWSIIDGNWSSLVIHVCLNNLYFAEDINTWLNRGGGGGERKIEQFLFTYISMRLNVNRETERLSVNQLLIPETRYINYLKNSGNEREDNRRRRRRRLYRIKDLKCTLLRNGSINPLDRVLDPASIITPLNTSSIRNKKSAIKISYKKKKKKKYISRDYNSLSE